ncbi:MAG: hypothetical protein EZS28_008684 [Streblomastix strix]|uniref:Uncharacterized protein n=1 Tax=Streblomastix strix TaxID=222440 RepID=A0A5J4WNL6_9EUKA|nr:MAG: hypothetical protein EZS28_008684 [Streblomastix strix]
MKIQQDTTQNAYGSDPAKKSLNERRYWRQPISDGKNATQRNFVQTVDLQRVRVVTRRLFEWYGTRATGQDHESEEASKGGSGGLLRDKVGEFGYDGRASFAGEATMADMIIGNKEMVMNELLSTNHALRIIAGDAQMRRKVVIATKDAKEVLKTSGGATLLYWSESKKKVEEVLKHSKLIANQENAGTATAGKSEAMQVNITVGAGGITGPITVEVYWLQVQWQWEGLEQQILLTTSNLCELGQELAKYMGQYTARLFMAIQQELKLTWVTIAVQFMAIVSISRTLLATEATGTNNQHNKISETELGQQPRVSIAAAALRCQKWGERACEF